MERVMGIDKFDGIEFGHAQHARRVKTRDGFQQPTFNQKAGFDSTGEAAVTSHY
jgi:hypothetical protein